MSSSCSHHFSALLTSSPSLFAPPLISSPVPTASILCSRHCSSPQHSLYLSPYHIYSLPLLSPINALPFLTPSSPLSFTLLLLPFPSFLFSILSSSTLVSPSLLSPPPSATSRCAAGHGLFTRTVPLIIRGRNSSVLRRNRDRDRTSQAPATRNPPEGRTIGSSGSRTKHMQ
jgi:hypothetical protein